MPGDVNSKTWSDILGGIPDTSFLPDTTKPVATQVPIKDVPSGFSTPPPASQYNPSGYIGNENFPNNTGSVAPAPDMKFYNFGSGIPGQRAINPAQPDRVVKYSHVDTAAETAGYRQGLSSLDYQIDHILPIWGGGTNNDENKMVLPTALHIQKTRVEDVARAMYYAGKVSLPQALTVAMNWQNKDTSGLTEASSLGKPAGSSEAADNKDIVPIELAQQKWDQWQQDIVKPKTTAGDWWNEFTGLLTGKGPARETAGANLAAATSNTPGGEFLKSAASGASLGIIPATPEQYEGSDSFGTKMAQVAGGLAGQLPWFEVAGGLIGKAAAAIPATGRLGELLTQIAGRAPASTELVGKGGKVINGLRIGGELTRTAEGATKASSWTKLTPTVARIVKNSATFATVGQFQVHPYNTSRVQNLLKDIATGTVFGVIPPTLVGTAGTFVAAYGLAAADGAHTKDALTNALVVSILHAGGALSKQAPIDLQKAAIENSVKFRHGLELSTPQFTEDGTPFITKEEAIKNFTADNGKLLKAAGITNTNDTYDPAKIDAYKQLLSQHKYTTRALIVNGLPPEQRAAAWTEDVYSLFDNANKITPDTFTGVPQRAVNAQDTADLVYREDSLTRLDDKTLSKLPTDSQNLVSSAVQLVPTGQMKNPRINLNIQRLVTEENVVTNPIRIFAVLRNEPEFSQHIDSVRSQTGKPRLLNKNANVEFYAEDPVEYTLHSIGFAPENQARVITQNNGFRPKGAPETHMSAHGESLGQTMKLLGIDHMQVSLVPTNEIVGGKPVEGTHTNVAYQAGGHFARIEITPADWAHAQRMANSDEKGNRVYSDQYYADEERAQQNANTPGRDPIEDVKWKKIMGDAETGLGGHLMSPTLANIERAFKVGDHLALKKAFHGMGMKLTSREAETLMANSGQFTVGEFITIQASQKAAGMLDKGPAAHADMLSYLTPEIRKKVWDIHILDNSFQDKNPAPKAPAKAPVAKTITDVVKATKPEPTPVAKTVSSVVKASKTLTTDVERNPDGTTWYTQKPDSKSVPGRFAAAGHDVAWLVEPKEFRDAKPVFADSVRIDGKIYTKDQAFRMFKGDTTVKAPDKVTGLSKEETKTDVETSTKPISIDSISTDPKWQGDILVSKLMRKVDDTWDYSEDFSYISKLRGNSTVTAREKGLIDKSGKITAAGREYLRSSENPTPIEAPETPAPIQQTVSKVIEKAPWKKAKTDVEAPTKAAPVQGGWTKAKTDIVPVEPKVLTGEIDRTQPGKPTTRQLRPGEYESMQIKAPRVTQQAPLSSKVPDIVGKSNTEGRYIEVPRESNPNYTDLQWVKPEMSTPIGKKFTFPKLSAKELAILREQAKPTKSRSKAKVKTLEEDPGHSIGAAEETAGTEPPEKAGIVLSGHNEGDAFIPTGKDIKEMSNKELASIYKQATSQTQTAISGKDIVDRTSTSHDKLVKLKEQIHDLIVSKINKDIKAIDKGKSDGTDLRELTPIIRDKGAALISPVQKNQFIPKDKFSTGIRPDLEQQIAKGKNPVFPYVLREVLARAKDKSGTSLIDSPELGKLMRSKEFERLFTSDEARDTVSEGEGGGQKRGYMIARMMAKPGTEGYGKNMKSALEKYKKVLEDERDINVEETPAPKNTETKHLSGAGPIDLRAKASSTLIGEAGGVKTPLTDYVEGTTRLDDFAKRMGGQIGGVDQLKFVRDQLKEEQGKTTGKDYAKIKVLKKIEKDLAAITPNEASSDFAVNLGLELRTLVNDKLPKEEQFGWSPTEDLRKEFSSTGPSAKLTKLRTELQKAAKTRPKSLLKPIDIEKTN